MASEASGGTGRGMSLTAKVMAGMVLGLIVAEVFFVSFGVIAVLSGVSLISAVFFAFQESNSFGVSVLVTEAVAARSR